MRKFIDIIRESYRTDEDLTVPQYPTPAWAHILEEAEITEYSIIPPMEFEPVSFEGEDHIGNINTKLGVLSVFKNQFGQEVSFGAGPSDTDILAEFSMEYLGGGLGIMRVVATKPEAQGKGVLSELFHFANVVLDITLLSDTHFTTQGEALLLSLIRSGRYDVSLYDMKTKEFHSESAIGTQLPDGTTILSPADDNSDDDLYDGETGQRFFWALKATGGRSVTIEGVGYIYGVSKLKHRPTGNIPPRYFDGGE